MSTSTPQPAAPSDARPSQVLPSPPESRGERRSRHARRISLYLGAGVLVALFAVLVILITANTRAVELSWAVGSTQASLVWIILAAAVLGWLLGITTAIVFHHRTRGPR